MTIEEMGLEGVAEAAARELLKAHPEVVFTSGRRTKAEQAGAMASNIVKSGNRKWIEATYKASIGRGKLQQWVDTHPESTSIASLSTGLLSILDECTTDELSKVSKHLSGLAFDVQPVEANAEAIKDKMRDLAGSENFLEKEGGLVRWHAQF